MGAPALTLNRKEAMSPTVLYAGKASERDAWRAALEAAFAEAGLEAELFLDPAEVAPERVDYLLLTRSGPIADLTPYRGLRAILSLWAGVEELLELPGLPREVPLARMVEPGLTIGMTDYVVAHATRAHIGLDAMLAMSRAGDWKAQAAPLSIHRRVGVLGLGALGADAAKALTALRFQVAGWSRSPKRIEGVESFAGYDSLDAFLARSEILVLLIPQTPETIGLLNAARLAQLPEGAHIINAARGPVLPEADLLAALDSGRVASATLDVFDVEPLPAGHPYWSHPKVTVTPHIASITRPETASKELARQIKDHIAGVPLEHVVDFQRGY